LAERGFVFLLFICPKNTRFSVYRPQMGFSKSVELKRARVTIEHFFDAAWVA
jgi:hypothetical protein